VKDVDQKYALDVKILFNFSQSTVAFVPYVPRILNVEICYRTGKSHKIELLLKN
jgi:hypothetical protein